MSHRATAPAAAAAVGAVEATAKAKLPKLSIQPYKDELTSWTTLWDSYEVAIHTNCSLSDIEKFNYLFQGPALDVITGLVLTATN